MGYKEAKKEMMGSPLSRHSMRQATLRDSWENDGDGEHRSKKQKKARTFKPRPDSEEASVQRRVDRVVIAATNPRIVEVLKDILLGDMDELAINRKALVGGELLTKTRKTGGFGSGVSDFVTN